MKGGTGWPVCIVGGSPLLAAKPPQPTASQAIHRAPDTESTSVQHVLYTIVVAYVGMTKQFLNRSNVRAALEKVRGERTPECMHVTQR